MFLVSTASPVRPHRAPGASAGGLNVGALAGDGISGIVGGAVPTAIIGAIKNATAK